jgi:hypothetical protein
MFVRVSRGLFAFDRCDEMDQRLREAENALAPAIGQLPGLIDYYAGIDSSSASMIRVSVWDTQEHAEAMARLPEVIRLRSEFEDAGVEWEPINTYQVTWWVQST